MGVLALFAVPLALFRPDAVSFFYFIEHVAGGPTAARSVLAPFAVFGDRLGLDIPLADTKEYVMGKARGQPVVQARVVEPALVVGFTFVAT